MKTFITILYMVVIMIIDVVNAAARWAVVKENAAALAVAQ